MPCRASTASGSPLDAQSCLSLQRRDRGATAWDYWTNFQTIYDAYGSPPDPQTFGAVALDRAGRPLYISLGGPVANGPYDIDLTRNAPTPWTRPTANNPFGVAELERILRCYDRDAPRFRNA